MARKKLLKKKIKRLHRQGDIGKIVEYFLKPLLSYRPKGMEIRDWMDILFGASYRNIDKYVSTKECKIKGSSITKNGVKAEGFGYRTLKQGDVLYARTDTRTPNVIDIEVLIGQGNRSRVFRQNYLQWSSLKKNLELKDDSN